MENTGSFLSKLLALRPVARDRFKTNAWGNIHGLSLSLPLSPFCPFLTWQVEESWDRLG